jgi:hypothetical protein
VAQLAQARQRCEEARRQYSTSWQECQQMREALLRQEQALAGRALALERYRQEVVHQAADSARAEARLGRLERGEASHLDAETRHLEAQRALLKKERQRLDELAAGLQKQGDDVAGQMRRYQEQQDELERRQAGDRAEEAQGQQELRRLRAQRALDERQLRQVREELEGLARMLIEDGDMSAGAAANRAA